jgi:hypothetical protein
MQGSRPGRKLARSYLKNKWGMIAHTCNPSYSGGRGRRIIAQATNARAYLKNKV